jgi:hypothetical protein
MSRHNLFIRSSHRRGKQRRRHFFNLAVGLSQDMLSGGIFRVNSASPRSKDGVLLAAACVDIDPVNYARGIILIARGFKQAGKSNGNRF